MMNIFLYNSNAIFDQHCTIFRFYCKLIIELLESNITTYNLC